MVLPANVSAFDYGSSTLYMFQNANKFGVKRAQASKL